MSILQLNQPPVLTLNSGYAWMPSSVKWQGQEFESPTNYAPSGLSPTPSWRLNGQPSYNLTGTGFQCSWQLDGTGGGPGNENPTEAGSAADGELQFPGEGSSSQVFSFTNAWWGVQVGMHPAYFFPWNNLIVSPDILVKNIQYDRYGIIRFTYYVNIVEPGHTRINMDALGIWGSRPFLSDYWCYRTGAWAKQPGWTEPSHYVTDHTHPIVMASTDGNYACSLYSNNSKGYYIANPNNWASRDTEMHAGWWYTRTLPIPTGWYSWDIWLVIDTLANVQNKITNYLMKTYPATSQCTTPEGKVLDDLPPGELAVIV